MTLGDVLKKERKQKRLTTEEIAARLGIPIEQYEEIEAGNSPVEQWGLKLPSIAIKLQTPTSRLITETGHSLGSQRVIGQCGSLIRLRRQDRGFSQADLAERIGIPISELESIENGKSPLEYYAPLLLTFAEIIGQPIFNLFYPCGLPYTEINDYP
jgi:transcriptional regulator with XRE-family HTH domain